VWSLACVACMCFGLVWFMWCGIDVRCGFVRDYVAFVYVFNVWCGIGWVVV